MEREESQQALSLLKQIRDSERLELQSGIQRVKDDASRQAEEVRHQMADRIEKQLHTIETLIKDKGLLAAKVEEVARQASEREALAEKGRAEMADKFKRELRKEKEAWVASEKVRKEKWESDKIREIREGTVQKLEPTIQNLIEKNKEELRRAEERL